MGVAGFISRLRSVIKPQNRKTNPQEEENVQDFTVSLEQTESTSKYSSPSGLQTPKSNKGLRKPSASSGQSSSKLSTKKNVGPEPTDYLYFGEGISSAEVSHSLSKRSQSKSPSIRPAQPSSTIGTHNNPTTSSGKDDSGFLKTGMDTHATQMGYSNLTYGGSLQYDYAGTQAPGVAGVD